MDLAGIEPASETVKRHFIEQFRNANDDTALKRLPPTPVRPMALGFADWSAPRFLRWMDSNHRPSALPTELQRGIGAHPDAGGGGCWAAGQRNAQTKREITWASGQSTLHSVRALKVRRSGRYAETPELTSAGAKTKRPAIAGEPRNLDGLVAERPPCRNHALSVSRMSSGLAT